MTTDPPTPQFGPVGPEVITGTPAWIGATAKVTPPRPTPPTEPTKAFMADPVLNLERQMVAFNKAVEDAQRANWNVSIHITAPPSTSSKTPSSPPVSGTAVYLNITREFRGGTSNAAG